MTPALYGRAGDESPLSTTEEFSEISGLRHPVPKKWGEAGLRGLKMRMREEKLGLLGKDASFAARCSKRYMSHLKSEAFSSVHPSNNKCGPPKVNKRLKGGAEYAE